MAKANVQKVALGNNNKDNIYVLSASGNVYLLKDSTRKEQLAINPRLTVMDVAKRIAARGTIATKFYTKVRG